MIGVITVTNFLESPTGSVLLPAYAEQVLSSSTALGAVIHALAWMAMPLGPMIGGYAAEAVGLRGTYTAIAVTYLLVAVAQFFLQEMRAMDAPTEPATPAAHG